MFTKNKTLQGFTLIELIIVVTILSILALISFISFGSYGTDSRNAVKKSDVATIEKALDLYNIRTGEFPKPTSASSQTKTYKSGNVWTEGTFDAELVRVVGSLTSVPVDPTTGAEYGYSKAEHKNQFQILVEYDENISFSNKALASGSSGMTLYGNYNGKGVFHGSVYITSPSLFNQVSVIPIDNSEIPFKVGGNDKIIMFRVYEIGVPSDGDDAGVLNFVKNLKESYLVSNTNIPEEVKKELNNLPDLSNLSSNTPEELAEAINYGRSLINHKPTRVSSASIDLGNKSGACINLPANALYYNDTTSYSLTDVDFFVPFSASYSATPSVNTCEFKCDSGYSWLAGECKMPYSGVTSTYESSPGTPAPFESTDHSSSVRSFYGYEVKLSGDLAIVGAPNDSTLGTNSGAVYTYKYSAGSWSMIAKLNNPNTGNEANDNFGHSLDIYSNTLIVGAPGDNSSGVYSGTIYIYEYSSGFNAWSSPVTKRLTGMPDFTLGDNVDIEGVRIVSADQNSTYTAGDGSTIGFVGSFVTFDKTDSLSAPIDDYSLADIIGEDHLVSRKFGHAIAVDGNTMVVSMINKNDAVYELLYNPTTKTWSHQNTIIEGSMNSYGSSLDIKGNRLVIGDQGYVSEKGRVFVYEKSGGTWNRTAIIYDSSIPNKSYMGRSISLDGDFLAIGASVPHHLNVSIPGKVYLYKFDGTNWNLISTKSGSSGVNSDGFGYAIDMQGGRLAVGAHDEDNNGGMEIFE